MAQVLVQTWMVQRLVVQVVQVVLVLVRMAQVQKQMAQVLDWMAQVPFCGLYLRHWSAYKAEMRRRFRSCFGTCAS